MPRRLTECNADEFECIDSALVLMRIARTLLVQGGAPKAAAKVATSIKSVEGAKRHAGRRYRATLQHFPELH